MGATSPPDDGMIYIDELCRLIDRVPATVRMWERDGVLPKRLLPKRGWRDWRCWTHGQIHGKNGIIAWMKKNDMRPGNAFAAPESEHKHVAGLRKPKYLSEEHVEWIRQWVNNRNWYLEQIVEELLPLTRYQTADGLGRVIVRLCKQRGWKVPTSALAAQKRRQRESERSRGKRSGKRGIKKAA